jgi:hypothetical protein
MGHLGPQNKWNRFDLAKKKRLEEVQVKQHDGHKTETYKMKLNPKIRISKNTFHMKSSMHKLHIKFQTSLTKFYRQKTIMFWMFQRSNF